jgi:hypothetical protein
MDINIGNINSQVKTVDSTSVQEIVRICLLAIKEEQQREKRAEEDRRLSSHASSNAGSGSHE